MSDCRRKLQPLMDRQDPYQVAPGALATALAALAFPENYTSTLTLAYSYSQLRLPDYTPLAASFRARNQWE